MTQWTNQLLCKLETRSLDNQKLCKCWIVLAACLKFQHLEDRHRGSPEQANEHWVQLADPISRIKVVGDQGRLPSSFLALHTHALAHIHPHTCLQAHSYIHADNCIQYLKTLNSIPENS